MSSLLKPLKEVADSGTKVDVKGREIRNCFPIIVPYYCRILETIEMSAVCQGAGRRRPYFRCYSTFEDRTRDRESSNRVEVKTINKRREVVGKHAEAAGFVGRVVVPESARHGTR